MRPIPLLLMLLTLLASACGSESSSALGEICGDGTDRGSDCGGDLFCRSHECDEAGNGHARFTCAKFCSSTSECAELDLAAFCDVNGGCIIGCQDDTDCSDGAVCDPDGSCVRADPPPISCAAAR
jgi:hypothetical protein